MQKNLLLIIFTSIIYQSAFAQVGGRRSFDFLNIPGSAKVAGIGGVNVSSSDKDVNMFLLNPSLLEEGMDKYISVNYLSYLADINYSTLAYVNHFEKLGLWAIGLQYLDFGDFEGYDATGADANAFSANEFAVTIGHSHTINHFTIGANVKFATSDIASFSANALLFDIGGSFKHPERDFTVAIVVKNAGILISDFTSQSESTLPFDLQVGTTFKPEHMPFRFSLTAYNLYKGDIGFFDPVSGIGSNKEEPGTVDKIFRHLAFGTELLLSKNFNIRAGYNHLIRRELRLGQTSGGAGFSLGFLVRIKAFEVAYSHAFYHVAGGADYFTLSSNLGAVFKRKEI